MNKNFTKIAATLAITSLFLAACTTGPENTDNDTETPESPNTAITETIQIGYVGPLTGNTASYGQDEKNFLELWLEENPTIADKKIEIIYEDGQCDGQEAAKAAEKLINIDQVKFILGGVCSGESLSILPVAEKNEVLVFSSTSTSPELTGVSNFFIRNAPSDAKNSEVMANYISENYTSAAIITENNDFGIAYAEALIPKLEEKGLEIAVQENFNSETTDFKTLLQKIKSSNAEVIVNLAGNSAGAGLINKQAFELNLELPVVGTDALGGAEFFEIAKNTADGTVIIQTASNDQDPKVKELLDKYMAKYGSEPVIVGYTPLEWDRFNLLKQAIEKVGENPTAVREYLVNMGTYEGIAGGTEFFENGDSSTLPSILKAKDGKYIVIE